MTDLGDEKDFDDFEDDGPDDNEAVVEYGHELLEAVAVFGVQHELPFDGISGGA